MCVCVCVYVCECVLLYAYGFSDGLVLLNASLSLFLTIIWFP